MKTNRSMLSVAKLDYASDAWPDLLDCYQPLIEKWARRFDNTGNDVSDITQDVLCALVEQLPNFEHNGRTGAFRNWLRTITVNRIRQHWDRQAKHRTKQNLVSEESLQQFADPNSELSDQWNQEHDSRVLNQLLDSIKTEFDATTMSAFCRFTLKNEPASSIAKDLQVSANQIYKYKFRVVRRLKEMAGTLHKLGLESVVAPISVPADKCPPLDDAHSEAPEKS